MAEKPNRITVDLSQFPDLVVIYLGMRAKTPRGLRTLLSFGPKIQASVTAAPEGLLLHEYLLYSLFPPHFGMRQYWHDFDSLERWAHDLPHKQHIEMGRRRTTRFSSLLLAPCIGYC